MTASWRLGSRDEAMSDAGVEGVIRLLREFWIVVNFQGKRIIDRLMEPMAASDRALGVERAIRRRHAS